MPEQVHDRWLSADWPAPGCIVAGTTFRDTHFDSLGLSGTPCYLNQVHGSSVVVAGRFETPPDADGSVSRKDENICVVRTADCLPVLICSQDGSQRGAAHAGWRGLAAGVIENTVAAMDTAADELLVWLGPAISQPSFEVGDEVRAAFLSQDPAAASCFVANERGRWQADLYALARQRLSAAGVKRIYGDELCTFIDARRFYSYRRDADRGRMTSFVARAC